LGYGNPGQRENVANLILFFLFFSEEKMVVRTINLNEFNSIKDEAFIIDVRRKEDYEKSDDTVAGAIWKNPSLIDEWVDAVPKDKRVVIFCVRGGSVSNSVVDRLLAEGINASYIEGGIEGVKSGGAIVHK